jgi:hypothetical protein
MKRRLRWLFLVLGVVFLLWNAHLLVSLPRYPLAAENPSVLHHNEFVSTWCRALWATIPAFNQNQASALEFSATCFGFSILEDDRPPWLDYRGPPGALPRSQRLLTGCQAAGQAGSTSSTLSPKNSFLQPIKITNGVLHQPLAKLGWLQPGAPGGSTR